MCVSARRAHDGWEVFQTRLSSAWVLLIVSHGVGFNQFACSRMEIHENKNVRQNCGETWVSYKWTKLGIFWLLCVFEMSGKVSDRSLRKKGKKSSRQMENLLKVETINDTIQQAVEKPNKGICGNLQVWESGEMRKATRPCGHPLICQWVHFKKLYTDRHRMYQELSVRDYGLSSFILCQKCQTLMIFCLSESKPWDKSGHNFNSLVVMEWNQKNQHGNTENCT